MLSQNDDFGKDYLKGVVDGLGDKAASMIHASDSFASTDPTVPNGAMIIAHLRDRRASGMLLTDDRDRQVRMLQWRSGRWLQSPS